ncbi:MAG TPA: HlyD family efflux transporter periplasmic adaptor subunit [Pirellulales bacterium]|nr:HlyD family efflux transporter periplasmic adaptor subunit [Pirellulales bacterium]
MTRILVTAVAGAIVGSLATWAALRELGLLEGNSARMAASQSSSGRNGGAGGADSDEIEVAALARLEPAGGVVSINGTPGDRLQELKVELGQQVAKGDELAVLESHSLRQGELELAETQLREARGRKTAEERYAEATLDEADLAEEQAKLQELDAAAQQEKISVLRAAHTSAQQDLQRLEGVRSAGSEGPGAQIVSDQQLAHQRLAAEKAANELSAAEDAFEKLRKGIDLAHREAAAKRKTAEANRARIPSIVQIDSLDKQVELARRRLELTTLRAPSDGQILKIFLNEGETLAQHPVLQMADISRMVAVAEIYEDDVRRIRPNETARVESKALGATLTGHVTFIGSMVAKNTVTGLDPTANTDRRVVEARILLDDNRQARRLINLQVTAFIPAKAPATADERAVAGR